MQSDPLASSARWKPKSDAERSALANGVASVVGAVRLTFSRSPRAKLQKLNDDLWKLHGKVLGLIPMLEDSDLQLTGKVFMCPTPADLQKTVAE